ncbi:MAG: hypothetical protein SA339_03310 [Methanomassiliicoccus sp.]|nr:hypothetical protein [Methanomassiliicoccus sp.]
MVTEAPQPHRQKGWWYRRVAREADRNMLGTGERIGNIVGIFFVLLFFVILIDIQTSGAGFFTEKFGPLEQLLLYGSLLYGIFPALLRAFTANRNLGRLADVIGSVLFVIATTYLLAVFPFDVPSLLDYLLGPVSGAFLWITNDLVKDIMLLSIIISVVSLAYNLVQYLAVREELRWRRLRGAAFPATGDNRP